LLLEESLRYLILQRRVGAEAYVEILESVGEYQLARKFLLSTIGDAVQRNPFDEQLLGRLAADLDEVNAANEHFGRCLDIEPDAFFCRFYIVRTLLILGEFDSAKSHLEYMKSKLGGENYFYLVADSFYQLMTGSRAVFSLDTKDQFVPPFYKGSVFAAMCDIESALIEWEKSFEYGSFVIPTLRPHLTQNWVLLGKPPACPPDEVLARPDVQAFLAKMGIDEEGHKIIRQRALGLAGVLEIEL
jgi:tetratricopeptide (TPR) repeat protein